MTPAAKPSMESRTFLLISFVANTTAAPTAVNSQVKIPAASACEIGFMRLKISIIFIVPLSLLSALQEHAPNIIHASRRRVNRVRRRAVR